MNADALPLGHARFQLVSVNEDGSFLRAPFLCDKLAQETADFLKKIHPEGTFFVNEPTSVLPALRGKV